MKPTHQRNILEDFQTKGRLYREDLMNNRKRYGLHFDRRIRELNKFYLIEREYKGKGQEKYIDSWVFKGSRDDGQMILGLTG